MRDRMGGGVSAGLDVFDRARLISLVRKWPGNRFGMLLAT